MQKLLLFAISLCFLASCNQKEIDQLNQEKTELQAQLELEREQSALKDSSINQFFESFAEIEQSLEEVRQKEEGLAKLSVKGDIKQNKKEQIVNDINSMGEMLAKNKGRIRALNDLLRKANIKSDKLKETILGLEERILNKDAEINKLTKGLANANSALSALNQLYMSKVMENQEMDADLHTAYYAFGTYKELKENNILNKEGGIIGIGSTKSLTDDFDKSYFKQIDVRETEFIQLFAKKAELATEHPAISYELKADSEGLLTLVIKDYDEFWSVSNYLVVVTK